MAPEQGASECRDLWLYTTDMGLITVHGHAGIRRLGLGDVVRTHKCLACMSSILVQPSRPGYISSVEDLLEVTIGGGWDIYSATGLGLGSGSVCEKVTLASKS